MQDKIIRLRKGKKGRLRPGHPWIFKGQILKLTSNIKPGDIVTVISNEDNFIGRGYFNPASEISIRLFTFSDEVIDDNFLHKKIKEAIERREFLSGLTNAKRLIYSEADNLPGLIADLYDDTLVIQIYTLGMEKLKSRIIEIIKDVVAPKYIYEKSTSHFRKIEGLKPLQVWHGPAREGDIEIFEGKAKFVVDIIKGHKTGFYLDQRRSRQALGEISKNKKVLDLFCYTGGFSVNAALAGANSVVAVDIKQDWLDLAAKNAALNGVTANIEFIADDAFKALKKVCDSGEKFDIIILDPPSFAKDRRSVVMASKGYKELNSMAFDTLADGGVLCTFSCSHSITNDIFSEIIKDSAKAAKKQFTILKRCRQDKDHRIVKEIPETEYLKGYFLKVE